MRDGSRPFGGQSNGHFRDKVGKPLKRAVVKEELVALTGDWITAIYLSQLLYWQERCSDIDRYIAEEKRRLEAVGQLCEIQPTHGWIYKSAEELATETMVNLSPSNVRRHLLRLVVDLGVVHERSNPHQKWDRKKQYRVDLIALKTKLEALIDSDGRSSGYTLDGWRFIFPDENDGVDPGVGPFSTTENGVSKAENGVGAIENGHSAVESRTSRNRRAIAETTTETPTKTSSRDHLDEIGKAVELLMREKKMNSNEAERLGREFGSYRVRKAIGIADWMDFKRLIRGGPDGRRAWVIKAIREDFPVPEQMRIDRNRNWMEFEEWREEREAGAFDGAVDFVVQAEIDLFLKKNGAKSLHRIFLSEVKKAEPFLHNTYKDRDPDCDVMLRAKLFTWFKGRLK